MTGSIKHMSPKNEPEKWCYHCGTVKRLSAFDVNREPAEDPERPGWLDWVKDWCRDCNGKYATKSKAGTS